MRIAPLLAAAFFAVSASGAKALDISDDLTITGYGDLRSVAAAGPTSWLKGGLGKFRYGNGGTHLRFAEAVMQADWAISEEWDAVAVLRAEPLTPGVVDALEAYLLYTPASEGAVSWSVKSGAFFPTISLENDDLGWASPYTLTPSAINSWIGDELRSIGSEAIMRWKNDVGTLSLIAAVICCNDEAGILMADRGWAFGDRPMGLFERVRLPESARRLRFQPPYGRTGMFDEIDGSPGWYAGATFQVPGVGKLSVIRYDNQADPYAKTARDTSWGTRFWSAGGRTDIGPVKLIAQAMRGQTVVAGPTFYAETKFQSAFLLASYDLDDWRFSLREDLFATRRPRATNTIWSEDGDAFTAAVSWSRFEWLRLTGEVIAVHSRRGQYTNAGLGSPNRNDTQVQFSTRFFF
jgi:hypothetical protein